MPFLMDWKTANLQPNILFPDQDLQIKNVRNYHTQGEIQGH